MSPRSARDNPHLAAFGIASPAARAAKPAGRVIPSAAELVGEARMALVVLSGALAAVYAISALTLAARLPGMAWVLLAIAVAQIGWLSQLATRPRAALAAAAALNAGLAVVWAWSRTTGLPVGPSGPLPVGILDALTAVDSVVIAALALRLGLPATTALARIWPATTQLAIVLSLASLSALAGGHTATAQAKARGGAPIENHTFFCRLL